MKTEDTAMVDALYQKVTEKSALAVAQRHEQGRIGARGVRIKDVVAEILAEVWDEADFGERDEQTVVEMLATLLGKIFKQSPAECTRDAIELLKGWVDG